MLILGLIFPKDRFGFVASHQKVSMQLLLQDKAHKSCPSRADAEGADICHVCCKSWNILKTDRNWTCPSNLILLTANAFAVDLSCQEPGFKLSLPTSSGHLRTDVWNFTWGTRFIRKVRFVLPFCLSAWLVTGRDRRMNFEMPRVWDVALRPRPRRGWSSKAPRSSAERTRSAAATRICWCRGHMKWIHVVHQWNKAHPLRNFLLGRMRCEQMWRSDDSILFDFGNMDRWQ